MRPLPDGELALVRPSSRPARREDGRLRLAVYALARSVRLLALSVFYVPQLAVRRAHRPVLLRRYLQGCGGGFVKLGQILSMRLDLLPEAYCVELSRLLDQVPAVPVAAIEKVVSDDLGQPVDACFRSFDPTPLGSASIAQVHAAELYGGAPVAVKVIRPGVVRTFRIDVAFVRSAGWFSSRFGVMSRLNIDAMARELCRLTREELDLHREARNTDLFHRLMAADEIDHCAPKVYFDLSGPRVITMERIEGVPVTELMAAVRRGDAERLGRWAARGIRPRRTARLVMRSILEQTMEYRVFNADPHPANLIVEDGGTLAWVDFGMVGRLDEQMWAQQFRLQAAIAQKKVQAAFEALLSSLAPLPVQDMTPFEVETKEIIRDWIDASGDPMASRTERSTGRLFLRLFDAVRRARLEFPADLLRVYRTVMGGDAMVLALDPAMDWVPVLRDVVSRETSSELARTMRPDVMAAARATLRFVNATFNLVNWLDVRLPDMARSYQREFSQLERAAGVALRYGRVLVLLFVVLVLAAHVPQMQYDFLKGLDERTGPHLVVIAAGGLLTVALFSRLLGELRPR